MFIVTLLQMKAATIHQLKKELEFENSDKLLQLCLRLARFKKENKELLSYLVFEANNESNYIDSVKNLTEEHFSNINNTNYYYIKKSVRKILRLIRKYCRYSNHKETEVELLIHFCEHLQMLRPSIKNNKVLTNIYNSQRKNIDKKITKLHEDLQYDYGTSLQKLDLEWIS
jgi:hypothetical protein